ncbi:TPA: hypothetical protein U3L57_000067 [Streptococcus agalactiae]|nr:hypothetical protein [Streptococcus agalactiae]
MKHFKDIEEWSRVTLIRTLRTMSQTMLALIGTTALLTDVNWSIVLSGTLLSGLTCILMNISQIKE